MTGLPTTNGVMNLSTLPQNINKRGPPLKILSRQKRILLDSVAEGEGGMTLENGIKTRIISYKKRIASPGSMQDTGCLGLVHWDDPEGWYGEGGRRGVQDWEHVYTRGLIHVDIWQNQYNIVKLKNLKKKAKKKRKEF